MIEERLEVQGPFSDGYKYAGPPGQKDKVLYRVPDVDWGKIAVIETASADPAAGAASVTAVTIATGTKQRITSVSFTYVRDVNAANVYTRLAISDGTRYVFHSAPTNPLTANMTALVTFGVDLANATWSDGTNNYFTAPIPCDMELPAGYSLVLLFDNKQATDNCGPAYTHSRVAPA